MIEAGRGGQVVNVSSAAGLFGLPWHAPYSATKFGLRGVSEVLRFDLRRHRIGVTPGLPRRRRHALVEHRRHRRRRPRATRRQSADRALPSAAPSRPRRRPSAILDGVVRNRYLVYTSHDIRPRLLRAALRARRRTPRDAAGQRPLRGQVARAVTPFRVDRAACGTRVIARAGARRSGPSTRRSVASSGLGTRTKRPPRRVHHPGPPPRAVPRLAAVRRAADAAGQAAAHATPSW